jgi:putative ABC transport system permease protein
MNALGAVPNGILVPRSFLTQTGLREGDTLQLAVSTDINQAKMETRIVGSFNLFPTWYEEESGPLFVGNLDYLFEQAGGQSPYQVWVRTDPDIDYAQLGDIKLRDLNFRVVTWDAARPKIQQVQERPEQQGIFGFLFIGFAAAAILTVVGFLLYALFSYQRRFIELGVLRAGGLSRGQMATYLAFELIFLILFGGAVGTGLGALISARFIPYLQIGNDIAARIPPYKVIIAWPAIYQIYGLFGVLFGATLVVLIILLQRMKIFQAIKLGETV